jgi:hypothetical protein
MTRWTSIDMNGPSAPVASEVAVAMAGMIFPAMSFALSLSTSYSRTETMSPMLLQKQVWPGTRYFTSRGDYTCDHRS